MKQKILLLLLLLNAVMKVFAQSPTTYWGLSGNSGTTPGTHFLGTTDNQSLVFKTNNTLSGLISLTQGNTTFGFSALLFNTTGSYNTAIGGYSLYSNTTGNGNVSIGYYSMSNNTAGSDNIALGSGSLAANLSGNYNVSVGPYALNNSNTGSNNVAIGKNAMNQNDDGSNNTAVGVSALENSYNGHTNSGFGYQTLYNNYAGYSNVAVGVSALFSNGVGHNLVAVGDSALYNQSNSLEGPYCNTAVGSKALFSNTHGFWNTAVGYHALYSSTGANAIANTATGYRSLFSNAAGYYNTAYGIYSLENNTEGTYNVAVGPQALRNNNSDGNTSVGMYSLISNVYGGYNTALGFYADANGDDFSNSTAIGYDALVLASDEIIIGNQAVTKIGGWQDWTNYSDRRVKTNFQSNVPGLAFINKLNPVTYNLDLTAADKIIQPNREHSLSEKELSARKKKEEIRFTGFVAQEVEEAANSIEYDFSGITKPKNEKDLYGLSYAEFVVPLVKAVQELSAENSKKDSMIQILTEQTNILQAQLKELMSKVDVKTLALTSKTINQIVSIEGGNQTFLEQNSPNPFFNNTIIKYSLGSTADNNELIISNAKGQLLKVVKLTGKGTGQVTILANELQAGTYYYTLVVDGKKMDTKSMILLKK